jgi:hypothetical protein
MQRGPLKSIGPEAESCTRTRAGVLQRPPRLFQLLWRELHHTCRTIRFGVCYTFSNASHHQYGRGTDRNDHWFTPLCDRDLGFSCLELHALAFSVPRTLFVELVHDISEARQEKKTGSEQGRHQKYWWRCIGQSLRSFVGKRSSLS